MCHWMFHLNDLTNYEPSYFFSLINRLINLNLSSFIKGCNNGKEKQKLHELGDLFYFVDVKSWNVLKLVFSINNILIYHLKCFVAMHFISVCLLLQNDSVHQYMTHITKPVWTRMKRITELIWFYRSVLWGWIVTSVFQDSPSYICMQKMELSEKNNRSHLSGRESYSAKLTPQPVLRTKTKAKTKTKKSLPNKSHMR